MQSSFSLLRSFGAISLLLVAPPVRAEPPTEDTTFSQDFDELWATVASNYAYFDKKQTDWNCVRSLYRPLAIAAPSYDGYTDILSMTLGELYDRHSVLRDDRTGSQRAPYFDMLAEKDGDAARVVAIFEGSDAQAAGLSLGDRIVAVDGKAMASLVAQLMPRCVTRFDPAAEAYAINAAISGRRGQSRRLTLQNPDGAIRTLDLPLSNREDKQDFESRTLDGGIGYIAIRSFAENAIVAQFDAALERFRTGPGLIIDMRDNGGGDTAVARPIMGRFIENRMPYALMKRRDGSGLSEAWTEYVEPRGPFMYDKPVIVLTNRWSASMAEGFPMGMRNMGRATIVGTPMMGLGAAVFDLRLDRTGLTAQYSGEPVYDVAGVPREELQPDITVSDGDDILEAGIRQLQREIADAAR